MITRVSQRRSTEDILSLMDPVVSRWFRSKFGSVTEAQSMAVPLIHEHKSVLVSSPTGSGKTLTAFLSIINELLLLARAGRLEDRIYAVYVSPLKALANDINENLLRPLEEISLLHEAEGLPRPGIRVAIRTGDTLPSERQRQARTPPHVFITTPESLNLVLSTPVFRKKFEDVDYVIVDEVHDICDSKRGVALSVALERLQGFCPRELTRIGLSATVAPVEQVAEFLVGCCDGRPREVSVVEVMGQRDLDLKVLCPAEDMTALSFEVVNSKMYDMLSETIRRHKTTLVFTNTRSGTESVVYKLKERGIDRIGAHHGSLSRETRLEVEESLREGQLKAAVSSTSLELGIDIGSIDLVVQIGSPKSVAKGLQRIGRSGHQYKGTSRGRILVFEPDDLVECAVLCRAAHEKLVDRVTIPVNSLDVLAQALVGMSIERKWGVEEALALLRGSYCYRELTLQQLESVLRFLGGKDEFEGVYSKLWYDEGERTFGRKRGGRMIFYLNQGTIPEEADYKVYSERGSLVGSLSEKFVERLSEGDIFVLGGRGYEFIKTKGTKAFVKSASGRKPTVPSWTGEMLPRSFDLSVLICRFRGEMERRLGSMPPERVAEWLMEEYDVDAGSATTIVNYFREQKAVARIPTDSTLLIEGYADPTGNRNAVFHFPFGRRVNDALSRAFALTLSELLGCNVTISVTDDSFMLTSPKPFRLEDLGDMVRARDLPEVLRRAVRDSELFAQRFRHVATRSFMVLRNYKGKELSVARQQLRSRRLLDALHELEDFPVMDETYAEIMTDVMDLEHASEVLESIERGDRKVEYLPFSAVPSPFAHNVVLVGVSDIVLLEDKSMLLRELHRRVLSRALGEMAVAEHMFETEKVEEHFSAKAPRIESRDDILGALRRMGPMNLFREKGESIYSHSERSFDALRAWSADLLRDGKVRSIWLGEDVYVVSEDYPLYASVHAIALPEDEGARRMLALVEGTPRSINELAEESGLTKEEAREQVRRLEMSHAVTRVSMRGDTVLFSRSSFEPVPRAEALAEAVKRHLAYHAPLTVEDLAFEVGISEEDAEHTLRALVSSEVVVTGMFIIGEKQQYMLVKDFLTLQAKGRPVFERETVRAHRERKQFAKVASVREFFERFGEAGMMYDLFQRVEGFDLEEFAGMRRSGELLLGRFVRGRVRYVLAEDAPHYLGVYRRERLNRYETAILRAAKKLGSGTYQAIAEAAGLPQGIMRENFDSLDRKGYLVRLYTESESWSSRNIYAPCEVNPSTKAAFKRVLERFLRAFGPVTVFQAATYLDVQAEQALRLLKGVGARAVTVGLERTEMFVLPDELDALSNADEGADERPRLRILSLYDPFLADRWTEISSRYGEAWVYPVVYRSQIVGMVEKWLMAGSVEIREVQLDDPSLLGQVVDSIDAMMPFYNMLGIDIVRVRSVFGTEVSSLDQALADEFLSRGFERSNGMLVKGRLVTESFDLTDILGAVLSQQNLDAPSQLEAVLDVVARHGGLRSNSAAIARSKGFTSLDELHRRGALVRGHLIPESVGYCTEEHAGLYAAARMRELSDEERMVLRIVKDQQPVRRDRLLTLSPLGELATSDALKSLYADSQIFLDSAHSYVSPPRRRMARQKAWKKVIQRLFECYGIMSAESLGVLIGHEIPMREVRAVLRSLEHEDLLVKGFLLNGSSTLYWCRSDLFPSLGRAPFTGRTVLPPNDDVVMYLRAGFRSMLPETGRYLVFSGPALTGSFKGRRRESKFEVSDLQGQPGVAELVAEFSKRIGLALAEKDVGRISEWEITDFYHRSHPGLRARE